MNKTVTIIGGGIVGLAIAQELSRQGNNVTVLEKEDSWAQHQTGHNSGVIHAGPYYKPGSLKAKMCLEGNLSMLAYAEQHSIPHQRCGKLIVATDSSQQQRLEALASRAIENGVDCHLIDAAEAKNYEPHVNAVGALRVNNTGIIDYTKVSETYALQSEKNGAVLLRGAEVRAITSTNDSVKVTHSRGETTSDILINAAGLYSDVVAKMAGFEPIVRIIPFRGEYFELAPGREHLVRGLIYPVPDPDLPFLGVHLTRMIDGSVHAGPNAVLALAREGYDWSSINVRELAKTFTYPGFFKLAFKNVSTGAQEVYRSLSKSKFAQDLATLVPDVKAQDLVRSGAGVRAQAVSKDGSLVDDFVIQREGNQVHILNAPSPAATSSLEIAKYISALLD